MFSSPASSCRHHHLPVPDPLLVRALLLVRLPPPLPLTRPTSGAREPRERRISLLPLVLDIISPAFAIFFQQQSAHQEQAVGTRHSSAPAGSPSASARSTVVSLSDTPREVPAPRRSFGSLFNTGTSFRSSSSVCLSAYLSLVADQCRSTYL